MPAHFLGRDDLMADLAARLTGGQTMALSAEGLPGVGKTALAAALAHDSRILAHSHFSDGVLWAGLGKQADVPGALAGWAEALGSDVSQVAAVPARSQAVKNLIGSAACCWSLTTPGMTRRPMHCAAAARTASIC
jgi:hypothetical protein